MWFGDAGGVEIHCEDGSILRIWFVLRTNSNAAGPAAIAQNNTTNDGPIRATSCWRRVHKSIKMLASKTQLKSVRPNETCAILSLPLNPMDSTSLTGNIRSSNVKPQPIQRLIVVSANPAERL